MLRLGARARATRTLGTTSARSSISTRLGGAGGEAASANSAARAKQQPRRDWAPSRRAARGTHPAGWPPMVMSKKTAFRGAAKPSTAAHTWAAVSTSWHRGHAPIGFGIVR